MYVQVNKFSRSLSLVHGPLVLSLSLSQYPTFSLCGFIMSPLEPSGYQVVSVDRNGKKYFIFTNLI